MAIASKIQIVLETLTPNFSKGLKDAGKEVETFAKDVSGKLSALSFAGGLNFAGVAKFGGALAGVTKEATDFATQIRTGTGYADALGAVVDKIPIVGKFHEAGVAIRELVTGEKAAGIELEKQIAFTNRLADGYRAVALAEKSIGKRGVEADFARADESANAEQTRIKNQKEDIAKQYREIERSVRRSGGLATPAQEEEMNRLHKLNDELNAESVLGTRKAEDERLKIRQDYEFQFAEDRRKSANETEEVIAGMHERSLRRQGRGVESAIEANVEKMKHQVSDLRASLDPHELAKLGSDEDREAKRNDVENKISALRRATFAQNQELKAEHDRQEQEQARDNEEKLKEIAQQGNIERLKIQDDAFNDRAEREGIHQRSHLAEAAQIEEDFRRQQAELEKKYRTDHRTNDVDYNDPTLRGSLDAAKEERRQKLALQSQHGQIEAFKNFENSLKEQRQLWASNGDAAQQYAAKLAEVNEHFKKFHDEGLRSAELKKLNASTLAELRKQFPDHETPVELYGRTGSYADVKVGDQGQSEAARALEELKKQSSRQDQHEPTWQLWFQYLQQQVQQTAKELSINGI